MALQTVLYYFCLGSAGLGPSSSFWEAQVVDSSFPFCFRTLLFCVWSPVFSSHPWNWWQCQPDMWGAAVGSKQGKVSRHPHLCSLVLSSLARGWILSQGHPFKLPHCCTLTKYHSCRYDTILQPNTRGKHVSVSGSFSGANEAAAPPPSQGDVSLWEGQLKLPWSLIQLSYCSLPLPSPTAWGVCFQFLSVAESLWGARWDVFCCHTCSAPSTNG